MRLNEGEKVYRNLLSFLIKMFFATLLWVMRVSNQAVIQDQQHFVPIVNALQNWLGVLLPYQGLQQGLQKLFTNTSVTFSCCHLPYD